MRSRAAISVAPASRWACASCIWTCMGTLLHWVGAVRVLPGISRAALLCVAGLIAPLWAGLSGPEGASVGAGERVGEVVGRGGRQFGRVHQCVVDEPPGVLDVVEELAELAEPGGNVGVHAAPPRRAANSASRASQ